MPRNVPLRLLASAGLLALLAACGEPPAPPLTAPPGPSGSPGASASGAAVPLPSGFTAPVPTGALPPAGLPTVPYVPPATLPPVFTPPPRITTPTTTRPTTTVSPAGRCGSAPTKAQVLAVLEGLPGIPEQELTVAEGPFCSGSWQFATVQIAGQDPDKAEQLFVVTTGRPDALKVIEAGTDVCSTEVQTRAPAGIRVRACGA